MYAACLHCGATFGHNESLESMPIGRRVAFDAAKGRLWVICSGCQRWNLSPFDERWETVEQCERAFRDTRVRVSTDNIGLARLRDGTELVRIGQPLRPEFAAWRYGDQFGQRRGTNALLIGGAVVGVGVAMAGMYAVGASVLVFLPLIHLAAVSNAVLQQGDRFSPLTLLDGSRISAIGHARILEMPEIPEGWGIEIGFLTLDGPLDEGPRRPIRDPWANGEKVVGRVAIPGVTALPLLRRVLPRVNRAGAKKPVIQDGIQLIEEAGGPERFGRWAAGKRREWAARSTYGDTGDLQHIPEAARLAFEMSLNEETP
jgi:hypothetical protein